MTITVEWFKEEHIFSIELGSGFEVHRMPSTLRSGIGGGTIEAGLLAIEDLHKKLEIALREADEEREIPDCDEIDRRLDKWMAP